MQKVEHPRLKRRKWIDWSYWSAFHIRLPSQHSHFQLNQNHDLFILDFSLGNWLLCWATCLEHLQTSGVPRFTYPEENAESSIGMASIFGFETCCKMWKVRCVVLFDSIWLVDPIQKDDEFVVMEKLCKSQTCCKLVQLVKNHLWSIDSVCLVRSFKHLCLPMSKTKARTRLIAILQTSNSPVPFLELPNLNHNVQPCRGLMLGEKSGVQGDEFPYALRYQSRWVGKNQSPSFFLGKISFGTQLAAEIIYQNRDTGIIINPDCSTQQPKGKTHAQKEHLQTELQST